MKIFITGQRGFIGRHLYRELADLGHEVYSSGVRAEELFVAHGDADVIVHLAALGTKGHATDHDLVRANIDGTRRVLEIARGRVIVAGSVVETMPLDSMYAVTKKVSTVMAEHAGATVLRFATPYGPGEPKHKLVPNLIEAGLRGTFPRLSHPHYTRDFVFVADVVAAIVHALGVQPGVYTVGCGTPMTLEAAVEVARAEFGIEAKPNWTYAAERVWEWPIVYSDPMLPGWEPRWSFADGFRETRLAMAD